MQLKSIQVFALLLLYVPVLLLGSSHVTVCVTEEGKMQLEISIIACDMASAQTDSSTPASDCGDCTDSKVKIGETHRVALGRTFDLPQIQNAIVCQVSAQKPLPVQTYIEPKSSAPDLVGSSVLII